VRLIDLPDFGRPLRLGPELAEMVIRRVTESDGVAVRWWIGHDIVTGPLAVRARALSEGSSLAVIHHMDYEAYLPFKSLNPAADRTKIEQQRLVLGEANVVFAIGSKLAQSARQKTPHSNREIIELIPGLADVSGLPSPNTFSAITFGRLGLGNERVKQAKLAVAAFGRARGFPGDPLGPDARLTVLGLSDDDTDAERNELLALAEKYSESPERRGRRGNGPRAVAIHGWPYIDDRRKVLEHLSCQSVCMMLSLHEGFGLAGWEAIAARVPLIVSRNSGLYETVDRTLGGIGLGCIRSLDIRGSTGQESFQEEDVETVARALVEIHVRGARAKRDAEVLGTILDRFCTWQHTATAVAEGCNLDVPKALASKNLERWTPDFLLSALRDSEDVVQDAARRKHLYDHMWSRLKDPIGHRRHLIIFGGVAVTGSGSSTTETTPGCIPLLLKGTDCSNLTAFVSVFTVGHMWTSSWAHGSALALPRSATSFA
jgi:glycosyltransferase involved in cell wall biosynthesis